MFIWMLPRSIGFRAGLFFSFPPSLPNFAVEISGCRKENTCTTPGDGINFPTVVSGHSAGKPERYALYTLRIRLHVILYVLSRTITYYYVPCEIINHQLLTLHIPILSGYYTPPVFVRRHIKP